MTDEQPSTRTKERGLASRLVILVLLAAAIVGVLYIKSARTGPAGDSATLVPEQRESLAADGATGAESTPREALPRLVDLGADKCVPCKLMAPILDELKQEYAGSFEVVFIDVWQNKSEAEKYGIQMIPTQIFLDAQGEELFRHQGFFSRDDILDTWRKHGYDFGNNPKTGKSSP